MVHYRTMITAIVVGNYLLAALVVLSVAANLALQVAVRRALKQHTPGRSVSTTAISVLKPLCGADPGLYENLLSFLRQTHPDYELVLGVEDPLDPALGVVLRLMREFPHAPIRIVVRPIERTTLNPKVGNLINMLRVAKHEWLLISDSNVQVDADYLVRLAAAAQDPGVQLVSNLIVARDEDSLGARLETLHMNTFVLGGVCFADQKGMACVVGKSMMMQRSTLAELGGLESLRDVLAEDYVLGQRFAEAGHRVVLSNHKVQTRHSGISLGRFLARHSRWAQLRRRVAPGPYLLEPLLFTTPWLVALSIMTRAGTTSRYVSVFLTLAALLRLTSDAAVFRLAAGRRAQLATLLLVPLKDCLALGIWVVGATRRSVVWRGHALEVGHGSKLSRPTDTTPARARSARA